MARFIVFLLLASTLVIVGMNFVLGLVRRFFGIGPVAGIRRAEQRSTTILYNHEGTTVMRGDSVNDDETSSH